jgi:hypothetical protein
MCGAKVEVFNRGVLRPAVRVRDHILDVPAPGGDGHEFAGLKWPQAAGLIWPHGLGFLG